MMDKEQAIENLVRNIGNFPCLPFITDLELRQLFGEEVGQALEFMEAINRERKICSTCGGQCCRQMGCDFFVDGLGECPIYDLRPLICRFHYCDKFGEEHKSLIKELADVIVGGVSGLERQVGSVAAIELNMLLYAACRKGEEPLPDLIKDMRQIMAAAKEAKIDWEKAKRMFRDEVKSQGSGNLKQANLAFHYAERLKSNLLILARALNMMPGLREGELEGGKAVIRGAFAGLRTELGIAKRHLASVELEVAEQKLAEAERRIEFKDCEAALSSLAGAVSKVTTLSARYIDMLEREDLI